MNTQKNCCNHNCNQGRSCPTIYADGDDREHNPRNVTALLASLCVLVAGLLLAAALVWGLL